MSPRLEPRERTLWLGAVGVLAGTLCSMAVLQLAWVAHLLASRSTVLRAVARALVHVVWSALGWAPLWLIALAVLGALAVLVRAVVNGAHPHAEIRHV